MKNILISEIEDVGGDVSVGIDQIISEEGEQGWERSNFLEGGLPQGGGIEFFKKYND